MEFTVFTETSTLIPKTLSPLTGPNRFTQTILAFPGISYFFSPSSQSFPLHYRLRLQPITLTPETSSFYRLPRFLTSVFYLLLGPSIFSLPFSKRTEEVSLRGDNCGTKIGSFWGKHEDWSSTFYYLNTTSVVSQAPLNTVVFILRFFFCPNVEQGRHTKTRSKNWRYLEKEIDVSTLGFI